MKRRRALAWVFGTIFVSGLAACGGVDEPARAPGAVPPREPATVEEAQEDIAHAKAELFGSSSKALEAPSQPGAPGAGTPPPSPPTSQTGSEDSRKSSSAASEETRPSACDKPCRALGSMRRAVEALCRMTGPGDARCVDARRTLTESEARVGACRC